ncbi:hypothetical protein [Pseudoroseomonas ludipueritiae]|uniref:DUF3726 domain-containing protein n=1 Tax=Pseudoroseomonas ludipueritiae TaxID=198093 RepID=A0ABR7R7Y2_9PROT|nr:hypothetical protein [Pseudoroseomonas ludipueritiae]MBC9177909.1 hypothetical protein [Pseudoroseomonas ludipueritiae]MCG7361923.1 hypothetical protein [Roseomonas sp. ACRSG]
MLGLTLLLTKAATTLDQFCLARISRDAGVLTPEYLDPSLILAAEDSPTAAEAALRATLNQIAAQLQVAGAANSVRAILHDHENGRRQTALLALAGAAPWQMTRQLPDGGQVHCRLAADGQVYLLAGGPTTGATHAPHAMRGYGERLWILPADHPCADGQTLPAEPPTRTNGASLDSLSLDAALRDLMLRLAAAGEATLLADIQALPQEALLVPEPAEALPQAPAVAA